LSAGLAICRNPKELPPSLNSKKQCGTTGAEPKKPTLSFARNAKGGD
jgi:hypothetical protein